MIEGDIEERMAGFAPSQRTGPSDLAREIMSQQVAGPSMEPTVPEPSPLAREIMSRDNDSLMSSLMGAVDVNPDEAAKASRIGSQLGVGQDIALRNMPEMEHRARMMQLRQMQLQQRDPILAEFMSDQAFARMAYDDLPNLSVIGRAFRFVRDIPTGISEGFTKAVSQAEMSQILERQRERGGYLEEYEKAALRSYQQELSELSKETGLAEAGAYLVSQQLTDWRIEDVERVVTGGVIGGGAGFVGGPLAPATVPVGIALGLKAGAATTMFERSRRMETAMLYGELEPELGHDMANKIAFGAGILNASLDVGSLGLITAPLRAPLKAAFGQAVKEAVRKRTVRDSFARFGLWYAGSVAAETGTETLQEMNNVLAMELGLYLQEKPLVLSTPEGRAEVADRLAATAVETALGMVTVGLPGPAVQFYSDVRGAARAMNEHKKLENITKAVSESKLLPRNSAALESYIASTAEGSDASTVFIDAATTNDILRQSGLTDVELDAALPGVRQQIETLQEKDIPLGGSDITIPMEQFTVRIAKTPLQDQLKQHARLSAGAPSFLEAQRIRAEMAQTRAEAEQILATKQEADAAFVAEAQQVEDEAFEQVRPVLNAINIEKDIDKDMAARTIAKLRQAMVVVDAAEAGMTPVQYQRERGVPLVIRGEGMAGRTAQLEQAARPEITIEGRTIPVTIASRDSGAGRELIAIDTGKLDEAWLNSQTEFGISQYIGEGGTGAGEITPERYARFGEFQKTASNIEASVVDVDNQGRVSFQNGRHRFAYMRDNGVASIPVVMDAESRANAQKFGYISLPSVAQQPTTAFEQAAISSMDADYLAAVERGDMAAAQRMVDEASGQPGQEAVTNDEQGNVVPLSRRFDITSPKLFEQAATLNADYFTAIERGDTETVQSMIDEAAERQMPSSQVRDAAGKLLRIYHGSQRIDRVGNRLLKKRATSGPMPFFTDTRAIAEGYAQGKEDTSIENIGYEQWFKYKPRGRRGTVILDQAWFYLTPEERATATERLYTVGYENPDEGTGGIVGNTETIASRDHVQFLLREARGNALTAAKELWLNSGSLFNDEQKFMDVLKGMGLGERFVYDSPHAVNSGIIEAYANIKNPLDTAAIPESVVVALQKRANRVRKPADEYGQDAWDKRTRDPQSWMETLRTDMAEGRTQAWTSIPDWVTDVLTKLGYDGIKDSGGKYGGDPHVVWIPFNPEQIKFANPITKDGSGKIISLSERFDLTSPMMFRQAAAGPARGEFDPRTLNILIGKGGDVSTLAHELIHLRVAEYLRMARGATPPARVNADLETLFGFMGVEGATFQERLDNYETMTIDQRRPLEEKVTYNFEIYLYEGKAPSVELRGVFDRLAAWMRRVYKSIRDNLNEIYRREFGTDLPILTPEVRSVFDRMLASEEQIKRQEAIEGMKGLFQTQAESGMDNAEWAAYQAMQQEATEAAVTDLNIASMRQVQWLGNARARILRDLQKKHDAKRKEVTAEVAAAVKVEPVYRAMTYLRYGRFVDTDGAEVEVEGTHRLDIEKVRAMYASLPSAEGVELIRATGMAVPANVRPDITPLGTGKYGMLGRDGLDPDVVAEMFGYGSGDEMVRALLAAKPMKDTVAERTDAEMLRRYGDMNTPAALEAEVQKALHNEARARFVAVELRHIAKATQPVRVMLETAKQVAADMISDTTIRDLRPSEFVAAEARAARDAERIQRTYGITEPAPELAQRYGTDRQQALIRAKRAQLYQNQLAAEALRVKEYVDKQVKYLRGVMRDSNVKRMGAAAADQVAGLLERFEVAPVNLKRLDERRSMAKYLADLEDAGVVPDIAEEIADEARRVNYKQLKVSEFRDLVDAVKQIEHIGKNEQKMRLAEERAAFEEVRDDVVTRIRAVGKVRELQIDPRTPLTGIGRTAAFLRGFAAQHLKAASIARILDGGKEDGPLWNAIIRTANDASDMETRMRAEASLKLGEILKPVFALGSMGGKGMYFPSIGRSLNREARIAIALNLGNDGNRQRLLDGEGWTFEQLQPVLESLTEAEWLAVQKVWDFIDGYRPEIAAKERRLYGKEPEWVKPTPFTVRTSDGKEVALQGGYYPVKYDPVASDRVATVDAAEEAKRDLQGAYTAATTRRSFVKARAKEVRDRPLLYTLDAAFSGVNDVIHDLAWHEWLISTNRLLRDPKFANAVRETRGPEFLKQLRDWSKDNATGARGQQVAGEAVLSWLRQGISASGLGFNVVSAAMQITGFNQSIVRVGAKYVGQGIVQFSTSPFESSKMVAEKSSFMAERGRTQFREINEIKNRVRGQTEVARRVTAGTYFLMMNMQRSVDIPTWLGAYQKALDAGKDDAKAVALADQAVRDSQGSGLVSDLSAMERGGPAMKLFTVFYSYMNTVYNMTAVQTMTARGKGKLAADYAMLLVVPVVLGYAIKSAIQPDAGDDELDPEALARKLAAEELSYLMGTMVIAREFGGAAQLLTGAEGVRMGYGGPAGLRAVGEVYGLATQAGQLEFDRAFRRSAINTLGAFTGLPSAQINRTIDGIEALVEGEVEGPSAVLAPLTGVQR